MIRDPNNFSSDEDLLNDYAKAEKIIDETISILRLYKPGNFGYDRIQVSPLNDLNPCDKSITSMVLT